MKTTDDQSEIFVVVDQNDKIIGYKTRKDCHSNKSLTHRGTGIVIFNDKGEILIQKRSTTKDTDPGYLSTSASGHLQKGETYKDAAEREMFEEIGIKTKLTFNSKFFYEDSRETEINALFTGNHNGPFKINKKEVSSIKFVAKESLKKIRGQLTPFAIQCFENLKLL